MRILNKIKKEIKDIIKVKTKVETTNVNNFRSTKYRNDGMHVLGSTVDLFISLLNTRQQQYKKIMSNVNKNIDNNRNVLQEDEKQII